MGFVSSYDLDGNTLTVSVEEYYNTIDYPIEEYPTFEKQINAAADFNKVAILLKKSKLFFNYNTRPNKDFLFY